jgi:GTP-binding protein
VEPRGLPRAGLPGQRGPAVNQIEKYGAAATLDGESLASSGRRGSGSRPPRQEPLKVETAEFVRSAHQSGDFLRDGRPEVAFAGRSNVGKSSLLNRILGRKGLARVGSTPGRTRAVNYFLINGRCYFVDLPGYGWARAGKKERREWAEVVNGYLRQALPQAQLVMLVDGEVGATPLDRQAYEYLSSLGAEIVVAATKIDRVSRGRRAAALRGIGAALGLGEATPLIPVSAHSGEGMKELWGVIDLHLESSAR